MLHGAAPAAPSAIRAALLGANASNGLRAEKAPRGSRSRLTTYSAMHAKVTTLVKLRRPKIARNGAAKPHMPGLRRPQTRHCSASALVRRPHDGHRMVPVVLRNIAIALVLRDAVSLVEPDAEIDQAAGERAERPVGVALPRGALPARGAGDFLFACRRPCVIRSRHPVGWYWRPTKPVNSTTFALTPSRPSRRVATISVTDCPPNPGRPTIMNGKLLAAVLVLALTVLVAAPTVLAQTAAAPAQHGGGEASLKIPDLGEVRVGGRTLLTLGLGVCVLGLIFGLVIFSQLKSLPVHASMREISELIYETCKTYLITQGKFLVRLWVLIGIIIVFYFYGLLHFDGSRVFIILLFSLIGIAGSYGVAWFGIRINTFANSRTAFASLKG